MTTCNFCFVGYIGGMAAHIGIMADRPRQAAARNEYGWYACDRHIDRLWSMTAEKKGLER